MVSKYQLGVFVKYRNLSDVYMVMDCNFPEAIKRFYNFTLKVCKITTYVTFNSLDKPGNKNHF